MVKVGVIGAGFMGKTHGDAYKKLDNAELVGIADLNKEAGREYADEYDCQYYQQPDELMAREDIDIIDICLPTFLHEQYAVAAASRGKNVMLEKPFTLTLESADLILEAVNKAGVKFMVGQTLRFWPEYVKIKDIYDQGEIGDINLIYASRLAQMPDWSEWFQDEEKSGGGLLDLHLHDVDYACHLLGKVEKVYAVGKKSPGGWNHVISNLTFACGTSACIEGCNQMTTDYPFTMRLRGVGDKGTVDFNFRAGFNLENRESATNSLVLYQNDSSPRALEVEQIDPYFNEIKYFVNCIDNDRPLEVITPEDSRYVLKVIMAIRKSLQTGKVIEM